MLKEWARRRHNKKSREWRDNRYWKNINGRNAMFEENGKILNRFADVPIIRKYRIALDKNPYLNREYYQTIKLAQKRIRDNAYRKTAVYELGYNNL